MSKVLINDVPKDAIVFWNRQWYEYCQWIEFKRELEQEATWYYQEVRKPK